MNHARSYAVRLILVSLFKMLFKLMIILLVGAAVAGLVTMARRSRDDETVSFDQWPDVPENTAA